MDTRKYFDMFLGILVVKAGIKLCVTCMEMKMKRKRREMKCVRSQTRDDRAPSRFSRRPWKMSLPHFSHLLYIFTLEDDGAIGAQRSSKKMIFLGSLGGRIFFGWFCARDSNFGQQQNNKKHITHSSSATERRASNANKRRRWLILSAEFFSPSFQTFAALFSSALPSFSLSSSRTQHTRPTSEIFWI